MNIVDTIKQHKLLVIGGAIVLILVTILFIVSSRPAVETRENPPSPTIASEIIVPTDVFTPEQRKAIEQQQAVDKQVADKEQEIKKKYPWFLNLPLRSDNYFVYFDQNKATFVGRLYPKSTDNTDTMKTEIIQKLKSDFSISDVESYPFEWVILPE